MKDDPEREIQRHREWLMAAVPYSQIRAAGLVGGLEHGEAKKIAAAVSDPDGKSLDPRGSFLAAKKFLRQYHGPNPSRGLMLVGPQSAGKTTAAMYVLAAFHRRIPQYPSLALAPSHWLSSAMAIGAEAAGLGPMHPFNKDPDAFKRMQTAKVLLLDDLGKEREDLDAPLKELLDARRSNRGSVTLITTNLSVSDLEHRHSPAVFDRIRSTFLRPEVTGCGGRLPQRGWS